MQKRLYFYNYESFGEFSLTKTGSGNEIIRNLKAKNIPVRKIIRNGVNFKYISSISITTYAINKRMGFLLPLIYRVLYWGEKRLLKCQEKEY